MNYKRFGALVPFIVVAALGVGCQSTAGQNRVPPDALDTAPPGPNEGSSSGVGTSGSGSGAESVGPGSAPKAAAPGQPDLAGVGK
jgi:hypothetical protein